MIQKGWIRKKCHEFLKDQDGEHSEHSLKLDKLVCYSHVSLPSLIPPVVGIVHIQIRMGQCHIVQVLRRKKALEMELDAFTTGDNKHQRLHIYIAGKPYITYFKLQTER